MRQPENPCALVDEDLRIPFDLSHCLILATANDIEALPAFIRDRSLVAALTPPDGATLRAITNRIAAKIITAHGDAFAFRDEAVLARLAHTNPAASAGALRWRLPSRRRPDGAT